MKAPKILSAVAATILLSTSTSFAADNPPMAKKSVEEYATAAQGDYTGLIIDCRGLGLKTAMSPVIQNSTARKFTGIKILT